MMDLIGSWRRYLRRRRSTEGADAPETPGVRRGPGGIDWAAERRERGVPDGEKLYGGFDTLFPELHVVPHYQRRRPGTPVWVDGRQLDRRLNLTADGGEIVTQDEVRADLVDSVPDVPVDLLVQLATTGASVYDRDVPFGDEELGLNILCDAAGEDTALRHYEAFAAEVVRELPHAELTPVFSILDAPEGSKPFARWFLPESAIAEWLGRRA